MLTKLLVPIILQIVGVITIIAEIIVPSMGILTLAAIGAFGYSLYYVFTYISVQTGVVFIAADSILIPTAVIIGMKMVARSPLALHKTLSRDNGVFSQDKNLSSLLGQKGVVLSDLRPSGKALIEGIKYDVVSSGDFISKGTDIEIIKIDGNRIVVYIVS